VEDNILQFKTHNPGVSIVIPTLNGGPVFKQCLQRIHQQKYDGTIQIVVMDSGSNDMTCKWAADFGAQIIRIEKQDFHHSITRNAALKYVAYDFVVFLVQDAIPCGDWWLSDLLTCMMGNELAAVHVGHIPHDGAGVFTRFEAQAHNQAMGDGEIVQAIEDPNQFSEMLFEDAYKTIRLNNVCAIYRKADLMTTPFPDIGFAEDMSWALVQLLKGRKIMYQPNIKVRHSHERPAFYRFKREIVNSVYCARIMQRVREDLSLLTVKNLIYLTVVFQNYFLSYKAKLMQTYSSFDVKVQPPDSVIKNIVAKFSMKNRMTYVFTKSFSSVSDIHSDVLHHLIKQGKNHITHCMNLISQNYAINNFYELMESLEGLTASVIGKMYGEVYASQELTNCLSPSIDKLICPYIHGV
jgi:glycosyltransferase involved in cell wall biosynthesis